METPWQKIPIFAGLKPAALEFLTRRATDAVYDPGDTVVCEGENGNTMFVIRSGELRVWKSSRDGTVELARLRAGDFCGEMCILETLPRSATVEAITPAHLNSLSAMAFYQLYRSMPDQYSILILNIARDLSRRLRRVDESVLKAI